MGVRRTSERSAPSWAASGGGCDVFRRFAGEENILACYTGRVQIKNDVLLERVRDALCDGNHAYCLFLT